jgi:hypothetical protein
MPFKSFVRRTWLPIAAVAALGCGASELTIPGDGSGGETTGGAGPAARVQLVEGDNQIAAPVTDVPVRPAVRVTDAQGLPVAGYQVTFVVTDGGGTVLDPKQTTGFDGVARVTRWTLGSLGSNTVEARAGSLSGSPIVFHATASPANGPTASRLELVEGDNQIAAPGAEVPVPPAVRVVDELGDPIPGYQVTFLVTDGGGSLLNPTQTTNEDGVARVDKWVLGSPGSNMVEARAGLLTPVQFHATAISTGEVDHFVFMEQPEGTRVNEQQTIKVAMLDKSGNVVPLSGIEIYIGLFPRGSELPNNNLLVGNRFSDTENGIATFHLGVSRVGTYIMRALSDELPAVGPHGPEPFLYSKPFNVY